MYPLHLWASSITKMHAQKTPTSHCASESPMEPQSSQVDLLTSYRELAIGVPSHAPPNATENLVWTKAGYKERQNSRTN